MNADGFGSRPDDLYRQVFERNPAVQLLVDPADGRIVEANPAACEFYGYDRAALAAHRIGDLNVATAAEIAAAMEDAARRQRSRFAFRHRLASGEVRDVEVTSGPVEVGGRVLLHSIVHDVSERRRSEELQAALFRISDVASRTANVEELCGELHAIVGELMFAGNFYIALDDPLAGRLSFPYWVDAHDPAPAPEPYGRGLTEYVLRTGRPLLASPEVFADLVAKGEVEQVGADSVDWLGVPLASGQRVLGVLAVQTYDARHRYRDADRDVLTFVSRQIAVALERKRAEEQIRRLAYHDALTGLPNRLLFEDRLDVALAQARRAEQRVAVLFLDLDHFKLINDSLGHRGGDRVLRVLGERLAATVREGDTVARLGGDEFALVLSGLERTDDVGSIAQRLLDSVRLPVEVDGRELWATASLGASLYPEDGEDGEALVKHADSAMYRAKEQGRDSLQLYSPAMTVSALDRLSLETSLRGALSKGELLLHYQPILDCGSGRVTGVEALLRWQRADRCVPPSEFVPLAEITGLIVPIGPWVLATACAQLRRWHDAGWRDLKVGVNLSARQLQQPHLVEVIAGALAEAGLEPRFLDLEITESHSIQGAEAVFAALAELRALGVTLSIDDFGTGYSSLSYLQRLPVNAVKLDRSFLDETPLASETAAIASAVIDLAHALGLTVVAEGVETEEQRAFLVSRGCDRMQGFLLARPAPAEAIGELLAATAALETR